MSTAADTMERSTPYPARIEVEPQLEGRDRLTTFFRILLAFPHVLLVGSPMMAIVLSWKSDSGIRFEWGASGVLGAVAGIAAVIAWVAILFTTRHPNGLWDLGVFYLRWRVRAVAYFTLLRDDYPPFGEGDYPAELTLSRPDSPRDRVSVGFRVLLALPQLIVVALLTCVWAITTVIAWWSIILLGRYPQPLYGFGVGMLRWTTRVEAYMLLLRDEYPPFSLE